MSGLDHATVTVNFLSKDSKNRSSHTFPISGGSDNFVKMYHLINSSSEAAIKMGRTNLTVTIRGDNESQVENYISNHPDLIKAAKEKDHNHLTTFFH